MKLRENQGTRTAGTEGLRNAPLPAGSVTADNFTERAIGFMRTSGRANGSHPVIRKPCHGQPGDPEAWSAWVTYLCRLRGPKGCNSAQEIGVMTLPTKYPWDFCSDADDLRPFDHSHRESRPLYAE